MVNIVEIFQSACLIISSILVIITAIGILRLNDDMDKVVYVRIHILGIVDIAGVLAMIGLDQPLLAGVYFILAPIVAHAMANAYYYGEDDCSHESKIEDLSNIEYKDDSKEEKFKEEIVGDQDDRYTVSKLNIIHED
ncbi:MAG: cation:proton antiporter [Methanobrevibacter sp.]|jgi:energy-converting hydrogenase B subunit C|nr:cation:proton antiporter [Candidatus Methanovirga basalitermitum]